jgi:3'(2'), 5'-bisphosphate nucleotidase
VNDHELAIFLADAAGKRLLQLRAETPVAHGDEVGAKELAKLGDSQANDFLLEQLKLHRPDDAVLSEEAADSDVRLGADRVWIIDPVDGTYEYARTQPEFAVHVALWSGSEQRLIAGAVAIPNHDLVWSTQDDPQDVETLFIDRPLMIIASPREPQATILKLQEGLADVAAAHGFPGIAVMNCGSVGGKVHQILSGVADVYVSSVGFFEWDSAAPAAIAAHHGLVVTEISGEPLKFNNMPPRTLSFLAARPWLYAAARAALTD